MTKTKKQDRNFIKKTTARYNTQVKQQKAKQQVSKISTKNKKDKVEKTTLIATNGIITITSLTQGMKKNTKPSPVVEFQHVSKHINNVSVFDDMNFKIPKGSISIITGKSGVGKTTISRIIHGIDENTGGKIFIDGEEMTKKNKNKLRRKTAFVFQNFNLFPHMDVLRNIIYTPIKVHKMQKDKVIVKAHELLEQFGMSNYKHSYPCQLSGGQKQRVAIIRALMLSPELLIMDEPTASLDPELSKDVANMIRSINKKGLSVMIVTHDRLFVDDLLKVKW